jgi:glycosyltransferase involved in cell wall biosynthesis
MESSRLVSVILPTYNQEELLPRAIESVLAQTYSFWEMIVWDDGSTDSTPAIVRSYEDDRIMYFFAENRGASYARNKAIEASSGEYLAFMDSDDEWMDDKLTTQVEILNTFAKIDFLFTDFMNITVSTQEKHRAFERSSHAMKLLNVEKKADDLFVILGGMPESLVIENFVATDSVIIRRELMRRVGPFNESLRNGEDFELWWRMGLAGARFAYINKVFLTRFKPPGSLSGQSILACENTIKGTDLCIQEALSKGRDDLVPFLNRRYRNAWQKLITLYGSSGNRSEMLKAFYQSSTYGLKLGSVRLLLQAIFESIKNQDVS